MSEAHDTSGPAPRLCGCGCGEPVARRYRPGHDARHKSALVGSLASADWRIATRAADDLVALGWAGFAPADALRAIPYRMASGRPVAHVADVATWQVGPDGAHHACRTCPALTRSARAIGGTNAVTKLAADRVVALVPTSPALVARLVRSWDQCTTCTTDRTRDEDAEATEVRHQLALPAPDPRPIGPRSVLAWSVMTDDGTDRLVPRTRDRLTGRVTVGFPPPLVA